MKPLIIPDEMVSLPRDRRKYSVLKCDFCDKDMGMFYNYESVKTRRYVCWECWNKEEEKKSE